ncbi:hypothetical protein M0R45_000807 [Rubus argutus]|uniref:Uncharacterized protein n=1 Tax=Rubus argutus TaxID=59490 RepID=A0AAW1VND9_RUBAR
MWIEGSFLFFLYLLAGHALGAFWYYFSIQQELSCWYGACKKFFYSFWWGLRNLSNYGTNLETSTYVWENCFAILISLHWHATIFISHWKSTDIHLDEN